MKIKKLILRIMLIIPDKMFNALIFLIKLGYVPRFKNPRSFNEKINYIKLYSNYKLRELVADRIKVRDYVLSKNTDCKLIGLLWHGRNFNRNIYEKLPNRFVIKANHGSGMVKIVNKNEVTYDELMKIITDWLSYDYGKLTRQWVYNKLEKKLIVEEYIGYDNRGLHDFKFFCINGTVELVQVDIDRFHDHKRNLYNKEFNLLNIKLTYENGPAIEKPDFYKKAVEIAEKLSEDFDFIRVDLYITEEGVYFGEMTNIPGNGFESFSQKDFDFELGKKIKFIKEIT